MQRSSCLEFALVFLLLMGCAGLHQFETFRDARRHMLAASEMENIQQFNGAVLEYVYVARNFPDSSFYKTAIFKAAMLSGRKDNPDRNLSTSLFWLNEYLKLPLPEQEQESIQFLITLIDQNKKCQDGIAQLQTELQNQQAVISRYDLEIDAFEKQGKKQNTQARQLQEKLTFYEEQIKERNIQIRQLEEKLTADEEQIKEQNEQIRQLEAEVFKTQDALKRLKEIDVRIHKGRLK